MREHSVELAGGTVVGYGHWGKPFLVFPSEQGRAWDFEKMFALWGAYNRGTVSRAELGKRSQNTTYVLSILHWREDTQNRARQTTPPLPRARRRLHRRRRLSRLVKNLPGTTSMGNSSCAPQRRKPKSTAPPWRSIMVPGNIRE